MSLRSEIEKKIDKKQAEIERLEGEVRNLKGMISAAQSYVEALEDTLQLIPKDDADGAIVQPTLRPGTAIHKAQEAILAAGKPLHVDELLKAIGKPIDADSRGAMSGSLSSYVRKGQIFTRPAPNTFGLVYSRALPRVAQNGPPPGFGKDTPTSEAQAPDEDEEAWLNSEAKVELDGN
jgi:hypothetical protein